MESNELEKEQRLVLAPASVAVSNVDKSSQPIKGISGLANEQGLELAHDYDDEDWTFHVFLWGSRSAAVAWDCLSLPCSEGRLGLRDLKTWNFALLARTLWNIHAKKDTLWFRWVHHIYLKHK
ncbi:RNA-directed DNA polymerase (reversetranscriptase)-related family protein [Striga asiatica]|uniref:RNA-directed DNA polymerase (Reversetranscriptase)-related family protein n=1 Tax=Striga asiatica TaxID=4170 RepID=A0A5A7QPX1_STRAF|nr:RNA-directed DNA polymerase (reversetranscriptase)-related family protein [Striga asiatica]